MRYKWKTQETQRNKSNVIQWQALYFNLGLLTTHLYMLGFKNTLRLPMLLRIFCLLLWVDAFADDDSATESKQANTLQQSIQIDEKTQMESGIRTQMVATHPYLGEFEALAKVKNLQPLLLLRERHQTLTAELKVAKARLKQARLSHSRQQELFQNGIAAQRSLQEQEASLTTELAQVEANQAKRVSVENEASLSWGKQLAEWALSNNAKFNGLLNGQQQLLQLILPSNKPLNPKIDTIVVAINGQRQAGIPATLISRATQTDYGVSGESYFFLVSDEKIRPGMNITAWIPDLTTDRVGVVVPGSALLWYMDQAYVYVKDQNTVFKRKNIKSLLSIPAGYLVMDGLRAGEELVISGSQMLLSEELRQQIPTEQD